MFKDNVIDFVLPWVDGSDPNWRREFLKYCGKEGDKSDERFRDWDNLQYLFRSFDQCTPWVNKIYFVTWGHIPEWLNINHPKLNIINHKDFMLSDNLPVFNSHAIECNLHRIDGLSEHFVYFNDDTFILQHIPPNYFYSHGLPRDMFALNVISTDITAHVKINNIKILNNHFDKTKVLKKYFRRWFILRNGTEFIKSILLLPWPQFTGLYSHHLPQPFLKSTFEEVWSAESEILELTSSSKFRKSSDVNQFLFKWWQILEGNFVPRTFHNAKNISIWHFEDAKKAAELIKENKLEMICLNDHLSDRTFEDSKKVVREAFEARFPNKSSYEL